MFKFWKWLPQDLALIIVNTVPESDEQDRLLELIETFNIMQNNRDCWLQYNKDDQPN